MLVQPLMLSLTPRVPESNSENVLNKVKAVIVEGCKTRNITVEKAVRKKSTVTGKPGVIIATLENNEQRELVLKSKRNLKEDEKHKNIFKHADMDYQVRVFNQSMRTLVKELGKENEIMVRGTNYKIQNLVKEHDYLMNQCAYLCFLTFP